MQDEIKQEYDKIKNKLTEEEFMQEIENIKANSIEDEYVGDYGAAQIVVQNYTDSDEKNSQNFNQITPEIQEEYEKVKDIISEKDFLKRMNEFKEQESENPFLNTTGFAEMVVGELITEEIKPISEEKEFTDKTISELENGSRDVTIEGRVISISNPRSFKNRKGVEGQVSNLQLKDNTGEIRAVFWTQNISLLNNITEGEIIQITKVDIKEGYSGLEANLRPRSTVTHIDDDPEKFPKYEENLIKIADIQSNTKVNLIARISRVSTIRSYEKNGKEGKVASLDLQDETGRITYTLWNKNVDLIQELNLEDGDTVKIIQAQARERTDRNGNPEMGLTHWDGRIIKGDYDVAEIQQKFTPIADLIEEKNVSIKGIISKLQDIKTFIRKTDNTEGKLRNFDVMDPSGEIRVTVWGDDTNIRMNKGDIIKIKGGDVRYDEYTQSQYSMNTNFDTQITINPTNLTTEEQEELQALKEELKPIPIGEIYEIDDDGIEIDIIGRIISVSEPREFQRDNGEIGIVKSALFADETGKVNLSFWNEKAETDYQIGDAYRIENARTRLGMYNVDLNIGSGARMIKYDDKEAHDLFIPELSTLEKNIFEYKKIDEIDEDEDDLIIIGRIIEVREPHTFDRDDGGKGLVRNIEIADDTGSIGVVLWGKDAEKDFEIGQPIKLQSPRISINRDNLLEAVVSNETVILSPSEDEIEKLPSQEELMEMIYVQKSIESLYEDDVNVHITAQIKEISADRILLTKCPNCGASVQQTDFENVCDNCGFEFDEPKYTLMIPLTLEDETGEITATLFDKLAEQLVGMKTEEIVSIINEGNGIEDKIEDLTGCTIELIANVTFDEYNETNRLSPKKFLKKYY